MPDEPLQFDPLPPELGLDPTYVQQLVASYQAAPDPATASDLAALMPAMLAALAATQTQSRQDAAALDITESRLRRMPGVPNDAMSRQRVRALSPHVAVAEEAQMTCRLCRKPVSDPLHNTG